MSHQTNKTMLNKQCWHKNNQGKKKYNNYRIGKGCTYQLHIYTFNLMQIISLTISEPALFEHFTKALTQFEVTLVLSTLNKLSELIGTSLLLLRDLLLVHGLGLVWLLKDERVEWWNYSHTVCTWMSYCKCLFQVHTTDNLPQTELSV